MQLTTMLISLKKVLLIMTVVTIVRRQAMNQLILL